MNEPGPQGLPPRAGIGLRAPHCRELLHTLPPLPFLEVHSENYFGAGGRPLHDLRQVRRHYEISLHGVGLSLGSTDPLNRAHLRRLRELVEQFEPALVSEHLSWGSVDGTYANDLLPLPCTREALDHTAARVGEVQDFLGRRILVENISSYLRFAGAEMAEWEFLGELARRSGCGLLLDVNNIYVSARNHGFDAATYIDAIDPRQVGEIHLAGFTVNRFADGEILIDTHSRPVAEEVWVLYRYALARLGAAPTLIEWDADLPALTVLLAEAARADGILGACHVQPA